MAGKWSPSVGECRPPAWEGRCWRELWPRGTLFRVGWRGEQTYRLRRSLKVKKKTKLLMGDMDQRRRLKQSRGQGLGLWKEEDGALPRHRDEGGKAEGRHKSGKENWGRTEALCFLSWSLDLQYRESEKLKRKEQQRKSMKQKAGFLKKIQWNG